MPKNNQHITILYPLCPSYSGSTLLSLLLGNQDGIYGAGELFIFSKHPERVDALQKGKCSCNGQGYQGCVFWTRVENYLVQHNQLNLQALDVESENEAIFLEHNRALFKAIQQISGASIIVDNSKIVSRFVHLRKAGFKVVPVLLYRRPQAVVYSWTKRGHDWWDVAHYYPAFYKEVAQKIDYEKVLKIDYEKLVQSPTQTIADILKRVNLYPASISVDWQDKEYHHLKGNPMRFEKTTQLKLSNQWKTQVSKRQAFWIKLLAFPVKIDRYCLYWFWERFVVLFTWKRY